MLPAWIKAALAANDRLKLYLSLMQSVAQQATHPQPGQADWKAEIGRLGVQEQSWLAGFGQGAYRADDVLFVPRVDEWLAALSRDLHVMARPACERASHPDAALTEAENEEKFFRCCRHAEPAMPEARARRLRDIVAGVEGLADVSALVATLAGRD